MQIINLIDSGVKRGRELFYADGSKEMVILIKRGDVFPIITKKAAFTAYGMRCLDDKMPQLFLEKTNFIIPTLLAPGDYADRFTDGTRWMLSNDNIHWKPKLAVCFIKDGRDRFVAKFDILNKESGQVEYWKFAREPSNQELAANKEWV